MPLFELPVRVYYEDTDAGGVVYYANYLKFLERARTDWLRALGYQQQRLMDERGILFAVRKVEIDYVAPARLDDALVVDATVERQGRVRLDFRQRVRRGEQVLADACVQVVCLDGQTFRPAAIPADLRERLEQDGHE
jgi:acyl-CoA thioester hydrolase